MRRIWLLIAMTLLVGCGELPTSADQVVPTRVVAFQSLIVYAPTPRSEVIRTAEDWQRVWAEIHPADLSSVPIPPVDFQRETVLLVARGLQLDGCHDIKIGSVLRGGAHLQASVLLIDADASCPCSQSVTYPFYAVAIPATTDPVSFSFRSESRHC